MSERICELVVDVSVQQVVWLFVVPGDADRRTVGGCADIVFQDRIQQRTLMQMSDIPVPQVVEALLEKSRLLTGQLSIAFCGAALRKPATSPTEIIKFFSRDTAQHCSHFSH